MQRGFVHQDEVSGNYEIGVKLVVLGEAARGRFDIARAARDELVVLRDTTQQAATVCGLIQGSVVVLDLIQGRTLVEFGTRPGTRLDLETSAHGKVWLAFGAELVSTGRGGTARGREQRPPRLPRKSPRPDAEAGRAPPTKLSTA